MTLYVGNLPFQAEREDLFDLFGPYGEVTQCSLPVDRETGRKRGFAFVELANAAAEQKAIDDLQDVEWMGRVIRVNPAAPREGAGGANRSSGNRSRGERGTGERTEGGYGDGGNRW
ncbi:MAG: RNA-binding protein [Cyanobium sp. LacPavin_0920_WC12_MAG_62_9]|nr:RNA-binding protein [Cyanobium sp. LacPavin_0920_WC12_MAG_62_9]